MYVKNLLKDCKAKLSLLVSILVLLDVRKELVTEFYNRYIIEVSILVLLDVRKEHSIDILERCQILRVSILVLLDVRKEQF